MEPVHSDLHGSVESFLKTGRFFWNHIQVSVMQNL